MVLFILVSSCFAHPYWENSTIRIKVLTNSTTKNLLKIWLVMFCCISEVALLQLSCWVLTFTVFFWVVIYLWPCRKAFPFWEIDKPNFLRRKKKDTTNLFQRLKKLKEKTCACHSENCNLSDKGWLFNCAQWNLAMIYFCSYLRANYKRWGKENCKFYFTLLFFLTSLF